MYKKTMFIPFVILIFIAFIPITLAQTVSFETQILPIFELRCAECHGEQNPEVRLRLIDYEEVLEGSEYGIVIKPGDIESSYLIEMIETGEMPQDGEPVTLDELSLIKTWVVEGALDN